jgi:two-component system, sensor histidine kinase
VLAANPTPETVQELSRSIDQIVRSLGSLLNGLLDLSRLSAAHYVPEQQVLDLETLLRQVCAEYQQVAAQKQLSIVYDLTPIRMTCDAIAIGRIARNLMDNAIKYTEQGGISVATRLEQTEAGCFVVLSVADSGRGIPVAEQERIFEEFYQIDNPGRDHGKGVGLGLAIVRRLSELIGGTVQVNSQLGQGTRFDVRFPATLVDGTIPRRMQAGDLAPSFPGRRIYVVDDEPEILRSMQKLLGAWGIEVMTANSTRTSERLFEMHRQPDLMIVDLRLKEEENGVQLANRLRGKYGHFPILIITGETSSDALAQGYDLGFPLLQKPIAPEILQGAIASALATMYDMPFAATVQAPIDAVFKTVGD